jgi:hypothetical protein
VQPAAYKNIIKKQYIVAKNFRHANESWHPPLLPTNASAQKTQGHQALTKTPNSPKARNIPPLDTTTRFSVSAF